jgi:hypothetical protein
MAGEHKSPYRGFAISSHRIANTPTAMTAASRLEGLGPPDRYYIKQYEQETNYVANLLLDGSESMKYGQAS